MELRLTAFTAPAPERGMVLEPLNRLHAARAASDDRRSDVVLEEASGSQRGVARIRRCRDRRLLMLEPGTAAADRNWRLNTGLLCLSPQS